MTDHPDPPLPDALRASWLPWRPLDDEQAAAPRDGDCWTAPAGGLELRLELTTWPEDDADPSSPAETTVHLRLHNTLTDRELSSWQFSTLREAATSAEALLRTRLDDMLAQARRRLHHAA